MNVPIRRRLLVWQIGSLLLVTLATTLLTYYLVWEGLNRIRDHSLEQIAWSVLRHQGQAKPATPMPEEADRFVTQVWDSEGHLLFASSPDFLLPMQKPGLTMLEWDDEEWHAVLVEEQGVRVQVATTQASRYRLVNTLGPWLLLPFGLMIFIFGSLILLAVNKALLPLLELRDAVQQRGPENLGRFVPLDYPDELQPLVGALNGLLDRIQRGFVIQQRFLADAAHELRTPLTAVRLQTQLARQEPDAGLRDAALDQLQAGVDRATRLVNQLLSLARFDRQFGKEQTLIAVDLVEIAKMVIAEQSAMADRLEVDLGLDCDQPTAWVAGDREALQVLLGNLVDNALRYARGGKWVDVRIRSTADKIQCVVLDHGPGIPAAAREQVLEPFCRLANPDIPGSGLGLCIAHEIVLQHGGEMSLAEAEGGGLAVQLGFPACPAPAGP